ncbi:hypothetical protein VNO77_27481 [Canavalia gladiata]|uniref:Uncharacterized protein n=1 Tax=Canavalia gladiata TaxID=3824 RepID=A0AAN9KX13_CANGL
MIPTMLPSQSVTFTTSPSDRVTSPNNIKFIGSPIYEDGFLLVNGIRRECNSSARWSRVESRCLLQPMKHFKKITLGEFNDVVCLSQQHFLTNFHFLHVLSRNLCTVDAASAVGSPFRTAIEAYASLFIFCHNTSRAFSFVNMKKKEPALVKCADILRDVQVTKPPRDTYKKASKKMRKEIDNIKHCKYHCHRVGYWIAYSPFNQLVIGNLGIKKNGPRMFCKESWGLLIALHIDDAHSLLPGWMVESLKPVKYMDSDLFAMPEGKRAIELVAGKESAIAHVVITMVGKRYVQLSKSNISLRAKEDSLEIAELMHLEVKMHSNIAENKLVQNQLRLFLASILMLLSDLKQFPICPLDDYRTLDAQLIVCSAGCERFEAVTIQN